MIKIAICDDDSRVIEFIESFIETVKNPKIEYDVFDSGDEAWKYMQRQGAMYDLYFLDIEMKEISGIELAKMIRKKSQKALFVFVTGYTEYVYDVFDVVTFDFIRKPISKAKLQSVLEKALLYLGAIKKNFVFTYRKNTFSVPAGDISYIEKSGRKAYINTNQGQVYQANLTVSEVLERLDSKMFTKIHISCIVNLNEIISIERNEILLRNGRNLYIGRAYCGEVKRRHMQYIKQLI